ERYSLAIDRLREIVNGSAASDTFLGYFKDTSEFLVLMDEVLKKAENGSLFSGSLGEKEQLNATLYKELSPQNYENSYCNPAYAVKILGKEYGALLSALRAELRSLIAYAYEKNIYNMVIRMELFLEIYGWFTMEKNPPVKELQECIASFAFDYQEDFMEEAVISSFTTENAFCKNIVENADFSTPDYLYNYGEYIGDNERKMLAYVSDLPQETIQLIADTFTEGYRKGFEATGKDITIKKTVNIRYFIGFERIVRAAIENFRRIGLETIINRSQPSFFLGRNVQKVGCYTTQPNKQFECDHEFDKVLYFNSMFVTRKLECYKAALEKYKTEAGVFGGPAVIEDFGDEPFSPMEKEESYRLSQQERKLTVEYAGKAGMLLNQYVKGEERSFTIIAFPIPAIGEQFNAIFDETIKLNTLSYEVYQRLQQTIIDTLDTADYVCIKGKGSNETDLKVNLWKLQNPSRETIFENCVADVNIPVGEVFTSPILKGTDGVLHVSEVFLNGLKFENLKLTFSDGMTKDYSCSNF
ncbi:MAG: aminopeptidase, partial [Lachnospiraceae bacterium]|nr:aminopeptidase [Lachnospiraceae bacterium]